LVALSNSQFVFASPYDYFSPVDVGSNPQRNPPQTINNAEDKDPGVYSNDIDKSPITCSYENSVTETKNSPKGDIINGIVQWITIRVESLTQEKGSSTYTNDVFRSSHLQFSKDPIIKLNATDKEQKDSFKNFDTEGRNSSVRAQPYKYQLVNKGQYIEDAVLSLTKTKDIVALDEQIAWNCNGICQDLIDKDGKKPSGCTPITISEIGYYFYKNGRSTSYKIENNQAENIPFSSEVVQVFNNYSTYRPTFKSPVSSDCYETLYQTMPLIPRGTVNTKYVFYNNDHGTTVPTSAYRALPLAAALGSTQTSTTLNLVLPQKQNTPADSESICKEFKSASPVYDRPSPFNIWVFFENFIELLTGSKTYTRPIKTDVVLPENLVENINKDNKFLDNFIPSKNHKTENFNGINLSSTDQDASANVPDVGYKNSIETAYFSKIIIPKSWQTEGSAGNSFPTSAIEIPSYIGTVTPDGKISDAVLRWCDLIRTSVSDKNLNPALIASLIQLETIGTGNPSIMSPQGAVGLMQVMPSDGIAATLFPGTFKDRPTVAQLKVAEFNVKYGTNLLKGMMGPNHDYIKGLKSYGHQVPSDPYFYTRKVLSIYLSNQNACMQ
jgi:hypothetical protein